MMWPRIVILLALCLPITVVRAQQEPTDPPASCANDPKDPAHACLCYQTCDPADQQPHGGADAKCATYCRPDHCHCTAMCEGT